MTSTDLLYQLDPWLDKKARYLAARFPGLDPDEVYQRAVEKFLKNLERWLQQDATAGVTAQAKCLMTFCLRQVETEEIRDRRRWQEVPASEDGDGLEHLTEPVAPVDDTAAAEVLRQVRSSTSPPCALCLLSLRLPATVERLDAARAKAWKKGGSNAVPRDLDEAWTIYAAGLDRADLVADDVRWKDHVGVAWYTEGAVELVGEAERSAAAAKVERYTNRATEDLRMALLGRRDA